MKSNFVPTFWKILASKLEDNQKVFLALVAANSEHSPGTVGAKILVAEDGETYGTIGGGVMEHNISARAKEVLKHSEFLPEIRTLHHRKSGKAERSGMICAGVQTNLYYLCRPNEDLPAVEKVAALIEQDKAAILQISRKGMAVRESELDIHAPQGWLENSEKTDWQYREQLLNFKRIAIIGGGHCALALSRVMKQLGYEVFVFETRKDVATFHENVFARAKIIIDDYKDAGAQIRYPELTDIVVMTNSYLSDIDGILGAIDQPFPFIGIMGSRAKISRIFRDLREKGTTEDVLVQMYAPVGLEINSHTPEEIAISIAAQILQER